MNNKEAVVFIKQLEDIYSSMNVLGKDNETLYNNWFMILEPINPLYIKSILKMIISNETYPPTPATVNKYYNLLALNDVSNVIELFKRSVSRYGRRNHVEAYEWIKSQNPLAYKLIMKVGYHRLCNLKIEDAIKTIEREFKANLINADEVYQELIADKGDIQLQLDVELKGLD